MDTAVKKSNKENSKPEAGPKKPESRNVTSKQKLVRPAPLRSKNDPREENAGDKPESNAQLKPSKPANDSDPTQRKTLSQAFRTEQTLRHRKLVLETQKPPSSVPPKPLLPGTYKGRVVRSKIDCFRKPPSGHEKKPSENKPKAETAVRSKSSTTLSASSRAGVQSGVASRTKSWSDARLNTQKTLVINLCERLEEMETPSSCKSRGSADAEVKVEEETPEYEILEEEERREGERREGERREGERREGERREGELMDTDGEEKKEEKEEGGAGDKKTLKVKTEEEKKLFEGDEEEDGEEDEEEDEEEKMDSTPADVLDACVVKYSVKTTPFLQSVKKRMEGEMAPGTPGSRRKSSIKELRFLTPVRRSSRIHRNSSRLPGMLNEHDPCVSSLAELELLDAADSNAYIYRRNPALLQHLPDQRPEPQSSEHTCK
ncbi:hypothetical protein PGIGA_G00079840 [Pangasianodon gigas]|uniref:Uncharacterized protein n=1 Tax=Pangasianodon gigas TaxID=30993 RepID=A0ACC5X9L9_PANGG|nr:hypothetical protein [Pangasianodon gigas]